jgi:hypothetical protein
MSDRPWFRARASGLGWTPVTWEAWLVTLLIVVGAAALNFAIITHLMAAHR